MEFLNEYHLAGLFIGICTFLIIGLFHPVVVKAEYYWGTKCWWIFLILGIGGVIASLSIDNVILSSLLGVFAFSSFWTIKEVFEQEERFMQEDEQQPYLSDQEHPAYSEKDYEEYIDFPQSMLEPKYSPYQTV